MWCAVGSIWQACSIVFMGYSLGEPHLQQLFARLQPLTQSADFVGNPPKCAILARAVIPADATEDQVRIVREREARTRRLFLDLGVEVIEYEPRDATLHGEVEDVLEALPRRHPVAATIAGEDVPS